MSKKLDQKVKRLEAAVAKRLEAICKEVVGKKHAIIPGGRYEGYRGKIEGVSFNTHGGVVVLLRPYRLYAPEKLVDNHLPDARTYWPYKDIVFCE